MVEIVGSSLFIQSIDYSIHHIFKAMENLLEISPKIESRGLNLFLVQKLFEI